MPDGTSYSFSEMRYSEITAMMKAHKRATKLGIDNWMTIVFLEALNRLESTQRYCCSYVMLLHAPEWAYNTASQEI